MQSQSAGVRIFALKNGLPVPPDPNTITTAEDTPKSFSASNPFPAGTAVTYAVVRQPLYGSLGGQLPQVTYAPRPNFNGSDTFSCSVSDGVTTQTFGVSITVTPVNDAPNASDGSARTHIGTPVDVQLWVSDPDDYNEPRNQPPVTTVKPIIVSNPAHGTLAPQSDSPRHFVYTPEPGFEGTDSFTFKGNDGQLDSRIATFTITVSGVPSVANDDAFSVRVSPGATIYNFAAPGLLANDIKSPEASSLSPGFSTGDQVQKTLPDGATVRLAYDTQANLGAFTYTAPPGQTLPLNRAISFQYRVIDGIAWSQPATVTLTFVPNLIARDVQATGEAFTTFPVNLSAQGKAPLSYRLVTQPKFGTLSGDAPGLSYTPNRGSNSGDSFTYQAVEEDGSASNVATAGISVTPSSEVPVGVADAYSTDEDKQLVVAAPGVLANDAFKGGIAPFAGIASQPSHGTAAMKADGSFVYTPHSNWNGTDSFTYKCSSGTQESAPVTVSITVAPVNDAPVATTPLTLVTEEDKALPVPLSGTDVDGDALSFSVVTPPENGTLRGTAPNLLFVPNADWNGQTSLRYAVSDGQQSVERTVNISVSPVNDAPRIADLSRTINEDSGADFTFSATDPDDANFAFSINSNPSHGTAFVSGAQCHYQPEANYNGTDAFTYSVKDPAGATSTATVTLQIQPVNDAPSWSSAVSTALYALQTPEDTPLEVTLQAVDIDSAALTYALTYSIDTISSVPAVTGIASAFSIEGDKLRFVPPADWSGKTYFVVRASDGNLQSSSTGSISVSPVNDAPVASAQSVSLDEDTSKTLTLVATDADSTNLTYSVETQPANGVLSGTAPNLTYTPNANWSGSDSFTFKANDGALDSGVATVLITVNAVNHAPVASAQSLTLDQDTSKAFTLNASDSDGDTLSFEIVTAPAKGALSGTGASRTYTPNAGFVGTDSFSFKAGDGALNSATATVSITVNAVNHAPVAQNGAISVAYNTPANVALSATDSDGDALTFTVVSSPTKGTLSGSGASRVYTPTSGTTGTDSFTFRASDGKATSNIATITLSVAGQPPTATSGSATVLEDGTVTVPLGASAFNGATISEWVAVSNPQNGTLSGSGNSRTYAPARDFNGTDSFSFRVRDSRGVWSATATVSLSITPVNDAPTFLLPTSTLSVAKNSAAQSIADFATTIAAGPANESAQTVSFVCTNSNSSLFSTQPTIAPNGTLSFRVANGRTGTVTVQVVVKDSGDTANGGQNQSQPKTFSIRVG